MEVLPVDLVALASAILGISVILVPVIGLTVRFAFKPFAEALAHTRGNRKLESEFSLLEQRVALLERQLEQSERLLPASTQLGTPVSPAKITAVVEDR